MGNSDGSKILARQSEKAIKMAPTKPLNKTVLKLFFFNMDLAIWGGIKPIKLINPVTDTILATTKVENNKISNLLLFTEMPKDLEVRFLIFLM